SRPRSVYQLGVVLTYKHPNTSCFRIYRETLSRFSCAASNGGTLDRQPTMLAHRPAQHDGRRNGLPGTRSSGSAVR
ncbi:hypothetical protein ABLN72_15305, partial [Mycobacterium tuberculosis]